MSSIARSASRARGSVELSSVKAGDRGAAGAVLVVEALWYAYTGAYFWLHPRGLTAAPSLFMHLTGRPDPFCGLTRTFAWIWRGDLAQAVHVYPVGPLVWLASLLAVAWALGVLVAGRRLRVSLPPRVVRAVIAIGILALAANWAAKLIWLGV